MHLSLSLSFCIRRVTEIIGQMVLLVSLVEGNTCDMGPMKLDVSLDLFILFMGMIYIMTL